MVIWVGDIGFTNLSVYGCGVMIYRTPNIDRIGKEGKVFNSITTRTRLAPPGVLSSSPACIPSGQVSLRWAWWDGPCGCRHCRRSAEDADYTTGAIGKNHLGDRNEPLPMLHGFDEFLDNLFNLNTEEEPEDEDYPSAPEFKKRHGPSGVLHVWATDKIDETVDPRFDCCSRPKNMLLN